MNERQSDKGAGGGEAEIRAAVERVKSVPLVQSPFCVMTTMRSFCVGAKRQVLVDKLGD